MFCGFCPPGGRGQGPGCPPPPVPQPGPAMDAALTLPSHSEFLWLRSFPVPRVTTLVWSLPAPHPATPRPGLGGVPRAGAWNSAPGRPPPPRSREPCTAVHARCSSGHVCSLRKEPGGGGSVCELRRLRAPPHPRSGPYSSSEARRRVCRTAGSCTAQAACDGAALTKKRHGPWAGSKAPTTCSWTPRRRRPGAPGEHKFPRQESPRGGVPLPLAEVAPVRPGPRPSPSAQLAPCLAGTPRMSLLGTPGNPRADPRSLRGRTARPRGSPEPTAAVFCAPTADSAAQPKLPWRTRRVGERPVGCAARTAPRGRGQCVRVGGRGRPGGVEETRAEGGRRGARGRRAGERRGRSGAPGARVTHPRSPPGAHRSG